MNATTTRAISPEAIRRIHEASRRWTIDQPMQLHGPVMAPMYVTAIVDHWDFDRAPRAIAKATQELASQLTIRCARCTDDFEPSHPTVFMEEIEGLEKRIAANIGAITTAIPAIVAPMAPESGEVELPAMVLVWTEAKAKARRVWREQIR